MATQTGSIDFKSTKGFQSYASGQYATLAQVKGQFATCSTAAATQAKAATIVPSDTGWELYTGATITVRFTADNTHATPTLNVNSTGAKSIRDHTGAALTEDAYKWKAGDALAFTYDGTYWRMQDTLAQRVTTNKTAIEQNARDITFRATKEEAAQMAQPNLSPYFSSSPYASTNTYWKSIQTGNGYTFTDMGDGWMRVQCTNSGSSVIRVDWYPIKCPSVVAGQPYTWLAEVRNNASTSASSGSDFYLVQTNNCQFWGQKATETIEGPGGKSMSINIGTCGSSYVMQKVQNAETASDGHWTNNDEASVVGLACWTFRCAANSSIDYEVRLSLYEGRYAGPYKPYVGSQLYASQAELKVTNDSISSKVSTTDYNGQTIASLINQSADSVVIEAEHIELNGTTVFNTIKSSLDSNYDAKGAAQTVQNNLNNLEIGGRNLYAFTNASTGYIRSSTPYGDVVLTPSSPQHTTSDYIPVSPGDVYTVQLWNPNLVTNSANSNRTVCWYNSSKEYISIQSATGDGNGSRPNGALHWSFTLDPAPANAAYARFGFIIGPSTNAVDNDIKVKVEKGNKATDWTPAPEDQTLYVDNSIAGISIGGRNLLLWTGQEESYYAYTAVDRRWMFMTIYGTNVVDGNTVTFTKNNSGLTNNTSGIRVSAMLASGAAATTANSASLSFGLDLKAGDTLTFSCDVKTTGNRVAMHAQYYNGSSRWTDAGSITEYGAPADTDWHRYSHTFTVASNYVSLTALGIYCELTDGVTISARNFKLERGNKATDWSPAPEDLQSNAVKRTQRIWYRKSAAGAPATPGTASSNWVVKADDGSNAWTKMHVAISSTEKFIYTCEQYEMGDGTIGYTSVLLDNTITVIDGGNIITGSVTANQIAAGTITSEEIAGGTITSDNIAAGAISADRLDANALTLGNIDGLEDRLDAIDSGLSSISTETQWVHYDPDKGTVFGENGSANNLLVTGDGIDFNTDEGRAAWATGGVFHANEMEAETVEAQTIVMGDWALVQSGTSFYIDYIG